MSKEQFSKIYFRALERKKTNAELRIRILFLRKNMSFRKWNYI